MKKIIFFLLILAISASASHFPARFNPTGMSTGGRIIERTDIVVSPNVVVVKPGILRAVRLVFPYFGTFTWSTDSNLFSVSPATSDGRIAEVKGIKMGQGILIVKDQLGHTKRIPVFVLR